MCRFRHFQTKGNSYPIGLGPPYRFRRSMKSDAKYSGKATRLPSKQGSTWVQLGPRLPNNLADRGRVAPHWGREIYGCIL
jgi:hypothetical protein